MKDNYARIVFILDRSGSMDVLRQEAIDGYNKFLVDQRQVPGEADIQLILFNTEIDARPLAGLKDARDLDKESYVPNGATALYDAIGITIKKVGDALAAQPEAERPSKMIFAVFTDGEENSSKVFPGEEGRLRVAAMIDHQQTVYNWEFLFLGANMDAPAMAASLNIPVANAASFMPDAKGLDEAYTFTASNVSRMRTGG